MLLKKPANPYINSVLLKCSDLRPSLEDTDTRAMTPAQYEANPPHSP
uniref:Uncharacterized protein n=1 Tax=Anguilla anguilla TaxID=7936 RepID=A0A0E9RDS6_ANGAN